MKLEMYKQADMVRDDIVMLILEPIDTKGNFKILEYGKGFVPTTQGIMVFIEERFVMDLEENFKLEMDEYFTPVLTTKPGVNYIPPEEDILLTQEKELEIQLRKIKEEKYKRDMGMAPPEDEEAALAEIDREIANREA